MTTGHIRWLTGILAAASIFVAAHARAQSGKPRFLVILDTSGSMQRFAWPAVRRKLDEVLDAYPKVKGLQIMDDEGGYMFSGYARKWIPDTPQQRRTVVERLRTWNV